MIIFGLGATVATVNFWVPVAEGICPRCGTWISISSSKSAFTCESCTNRIIKKGDCFIVPKPNVSLLDFNTNDFFAHLEREKSSEDGVEEAQTTNREKIRRSDVAILAALNNNYHTRITATQNEDSGAVEFKRTCVQGLTDIPDSLTVRLSVLRGTKADKEFRQGVLNALKVGDSVELCKSPGDASAVFRIEARDNRGNTIGYATNKFNDALILCIDESRIKDVKISSIWEDKPGRQQMNIQVDLNASCNQQGIIT